MTDDVTYSDSDEAETYVVLDTFDTDEDALAQATHLVENGIGAVVQAVTTDGSQDPEAAAPGGDGAGPPVTPGPPEVVYQVRVMAEQAERAYETLGYEAPEAVKVVPKEARPPWKAIVVIWAIAMVLIPLIAGYVTYLLLSRS